MRSAPQRFAMFLLAAAIGLGWHAPAAVRIAGQDDSVAAAIRGDPFYTTRCAACDQERFKTGRSVGAVHEGRELRFCSPECRRDFESDRRANTAILDVRLISDQKPHYPLQTSIVSGVPLPAEPIDVIWNNRLFRVADASERDRLLQEPERYLKALDRAVIDAQGPVYGPTKCPVQGDFFDEESIREIVIGNRLIRLCCVKCTRVVRRNPGQYLKMVDYSNREAAQKRREDGR